VAKSRAQRKAEQRRRAQQGDAESRAQHDTQVPETADVSEAELAEKGADLEALKGKAPSRADVGRPPAEPADAPEEKLSRRAKAAEARDREKRKKESERRRAPKEAPVERRQRGGVTGFIASCWAELKKVQWPDRETLIQASAITLIFIAAMAAYLGVLDAIFNFLVQRIL
jgi:preprotein translocase SecE subunit